MLTKMIKRDSLAHRHHHHAHLANHRVAGIEGHLDSMMPAMICDNDAPLGRARRSA
jgi:hypothetical protein